MIALRTCRHRPCPETSESCKRGFEPTWLRRKRELAARVGVVATRKCHINCNETLSPPYRLSNGRQSRAAGEVVDARRGGFPFLRRGDGDRAAFGVFLERQR